MELIMIMIISALSQLKPRPVGYSQSHRLNGCETRNAIVFACRLSRRRQHSTCHQVGPRRQEKSRRPDFRKELLSSSYANEPASWPYASALPASLWALILIGRLAAGLHLTLSGSAAATLAFAWQLSGSDTKKEKNRVHCCCHYCSVITHTHTQPLLCPVQLI